MDVKQFALFYYKNGTEGCGTDYYLPIDGRYNLNHCCEIARKHAITLVKNLGKDVGYYKIFKGNLQHNIELTNLKPIIILKKNENSN